MKIYVLGSTEFMHSMVKARDDLNKLGLDGWIHENYDLLVQGKLDPLEEDKATSQENANRKKKYDYLKVHYAHILASDAVLIVNEAKNGINNYIGGNVLIEMGQAYVNSKKIFFLHGMPENLPYMDEILAMEPVCLGGKIENIKGYS